MKIKAIGMTIKNKDGSVGLFLEDDMPADSVVVFMSKEDFEELKAILKTKQAKD